MPLCRLQGIAHGCSGGASPASLAAAPCGHLRPRLMLGRIPRSSRVYFVTSLAQTPLTSEISLLHTTASSQRAAAHRYGPPPRSSCACRRGSRAARRRAAPPRRRRRGAACSGRAAPQPWPRRACQRGATARTSAFGWVPSSALCKPTSATTLTTVRMSSRVSSTHASGCSTRPCPAAVSDPTPRSLSCSPLQMLEGRAQMLRLPCLLASSTMHAAVCVRLGLGMSVLQVVPEVSAVLSGQRALSAVTSGVSAAQWSLQMLAAPTGEASTASQRPLACCLADPHSMPPSRLAGQSIRGCAPSSRSLTWAAGAPTTIGATCRAS